MYSKKAAACVAPVVAALLLQGCGESPDPCADLRSRRVLAPPSPSPAAQYVEAGGTTIEVLGRSGKIRMYSTVAGNDTSTVTIEMDALSELDADGNVVSSHSINSFASQDFTFSPLQDATLGENGAVSAKKVTFNSTIGAYGKVEVDTYVTSSAGTVGPGNSWTASAGDLKFNINFPQWSFCGDEGVVCTQGQQEQVGEYLELDIKIKGHAEKADSVPGALEEYSLGGAANLFLTSEVTIDGSQSTMPDGYPELTMQGQSQIFKFRFPKFSASASYDPLVTQNWECAPSDTASVASTILA